MTRVKSPVIFQKSRYDLALREVKSNVARQDDYEKNTHKMMYFMEFFEVKNNAQKKSLWYMIQTCNW